MTVRSSALPGLAALLTALSVGPAMAAPDFSGVWAPVGAGVIRPVDGTPIPLTPEGKARQARNAQAAASGDFSFDQTMLCMPYGLPRVMSAPFPFQILQTPANVIFLHQGNHDVRLAYLEEGHRPDQDPAFHGDSAARFEGEALVIETVNLKPGLLDRTGIPLTEALKVTERYQMSGADRIEGRITVEDPAIFTRPWTYSVSFQRRAGARIGEDVCMDKDAAQRAAIR